MWRRDWRRFVPAESARAFVAQRLEASVPIEDLPLTARQQPGQFLVSSGSPILGPGSGPDDCSLESYRTPGIDAICPAIWWWVGFRLSDKSGVTNLEFPALQGHRYKPGTNPYAIKFLPQPPSLCPIHHLSSYHRPQHLRVPHFLRRNRQNVAVQQNQIRTLAGCDQSNGIEIHSASRVPRIGIEHCFARHCLRWVKHSFRSFARFRLINRPEHVRA